jgi:hypothetical protein
MAKEYLKDELFEPIKDLNYVLTAHDRMRRNNSASGSTAWFPMPEGDVGQKARYFASGGFSVQRRICLAAYPDDTVATIQYRHLGTLALALCKYKEGVWVTYEEPSIDLLQDDKDLIVDVWVVPCTPSDVREGDDEDEELVSKYLNDIEELRQGFRSILDFGTLTEVERISMEAYHFFANKRAVQLGGEDVTYSRPRQACMPAAMGAPYGKTKQTEGVGSAYPWDDVTVGTYITRLHDKDVPVEILAGRGDFEGELMYRWTKGTIPGRLVQGMPKTCILIRATD